MKNYILNVYFNGKKENEIKSNELKVLQAYFNAKEEIRDNLNIKSIIYNSDGIIEKLTISIGNFYEYEYLLKGEEK